MTQLTKIDFGPYLSDVRGNKVRNKPRSIDMEEYVTTPEDIYKLHKFVTLAADVMFINGNAFTITSERTIKFVTINHIIIQTSKTA